MDGGEGLNRGGMGVLRACFIKVRTAELEVNWVD
jgi:hypothetical protein